MPARSRYSLVVGISVAVFACSLVQQARAGVITTQQYMSATERRAAIERVDAVLARKEVRRELQRLGVDPAAANERVAALTDEELQTLATDLDNQPAGGDVLAVFGIVFIVLLILELTGVIHIFKHF